MFKQVILLTTATVIALIVRFVPWGSYWPSSLAAIARKTTRSMLHLDARRAVINDYWRDYRRHGIEATRPRVDRFYADASPAVQRLLRYAAMDPEHGLVRWGNVDWTILLSSKVFEADDTGRSFRLRPNTRSIWLQDVPLPTNVPMFLLVPDGPGLAEAVAGMNVRLIETSRQTTNSWGLRGPEPDLDAPLRVLVLGDSYMQGMFIGDDETPPECLRRDLQDRLNTRVSVLNAGLMAYSPEQYYFSLEAFADRYRPHVVVTSLFANDFGNILKVTNEGNGDWDEARYWLEKIANFCTDRHWSHLFVAAPFKANVVARRKPGHYPGQIFNAVDDSTMSFVDPLEDFVNAHLKLTPPSIPLGGEPIPCVLYNDPIPDDHFSAVGSQVWAKSVAERIVLLLNRERALTEQSALRQERPAPAAHGLPRTNATGVSSRH